MNHQYLFKIILLVVFFIQGCNDTKVEVIKQPKNTKLSAKPQPQQLANPIYGVSSLIIDGDEIGFIYTPSNYSKKKATPLFVGLHGSGGNAWDTWSEYISIAENKDVIILAIDSKDYTWDFIKTDFGPDVKRLDKALKYTFNMYNINSEKIALGGFSDGGSYALSLGLLNGDLFTDIIAYSPGFIKDSDHFIGKPKVYITHGKIDTVLSVTLSRDKIVPYLQQKNYTVNYHEHSGGHTFTQEMFESNINLFIE